MKAPDGEVFVLVKVWLENTSRFDRNFMMRHMAKLIRENGDRAKEFFWHEPANQSTLSSRLDAGGYLREDDSRPRGCAGVALFSSRNRAFNIPV